MGIALPVIPFSQFGVLQTSALADALMPASFLAVNPFAPSPSSLQMAGELASLVRSDPKKGVAAAFVGIGPFLGAERRNAQNFFLRTSGQLPESLPDLVAIVERRFGGQIPDDLREVDVEHRRKIDAALEIIRRADEGEESATQSLLSLDATMIVGLMSDFDADLSKRAIGVTIRLAAEGNWWAAGYLYHNATSSRGTSGLVRRPAASKYVSAFEEAQNRPGSRLIEVLQSFHKTSAAARAVPDLETMLLGSNNFLLYFLPDDDFSKEWKWDAPAMKRLRAEHPQLVESIVEIVRRSRERGALFQEKQTLLWEAYRIMATYIDLIDVYDPSALMR